MIMHAGSVGATDYSNSLGLFYNSMNLLHFIHGRLFEL